MNVALQEVFALVGEQAVELRILKKEVSGLGEVIKDQRAKLEDFESSKDTDVDDQERDEGPQGD